jgi:hypothetical protein
VPVLRRLEDLDRIGRLVILSSLHSFHFICLNKKVSRIDDKAALKKRLQLNFLEVSQRAPLFNQYRNMIARVPLLFCLLAGSSAAFAVAPQSKTFMAKKTVLSMSSGGASPAPAAAVDLKVSLRRVFACGSNLFLTYFIRRIVFKNL